MILQRFVHALRAGEPNRISGMLLEALALERMNDRHIDNGCSCVRGRYGWRSHAIISWQISSKDSQSEEGESMWYVMQVASGQENRTIFLVEKMISKGILGNCFAPVRRLKKKFHGAWHEVTEKLFPGYVFITSEQPQLLYEELKQIPALTKMLGRCGKFFAPLSEKDVRIMEKLRNGMNDSRNMEVEISRIAVEEGKQIRILSGPLVNLEGQIRKVNLHKRIAVVEVEFMGNKSLVHLGVEMVGPNK